MRIAFQVSLALSLSCISACQSPPPSNATSPIGLSGGPLVDGLTVVVLDETTGAELGTATVTCGDGSPASLMGSAVRCDATGLDGASIVVDAPGYVTERWMGITSAHAVVALAMRAEPERALHGEITGGSDRVSVGVTGAFGILRSGDVTRGAAGCADASLCNVTLSTSPAGAHDAAILDQGAGRLVLVRDLPIGPDGAFAVDVLGATESASLVTLTVTLPDAAGLTEVVGVPGLATDHGVALLGSLLDGTSTLAPVREGTLASERLWFVAHARTADGSGESFALDRELPAGETTVTLPPTFLAVPVASVSGGVVTITGDAEVSLYIVESSDAGGVVERAIVFAGASTIAVPVRGASQRVRAVASSLGADIDLELAADTATRFADRVL